MPPPPSTVGSLDISVLVAIFVLVLIVYSFGPRGRFFD